MKANLIKVTMYIIDHGDNLEGKSGLSNIFNNALNTISLNAHVFITKFGKKSIEWDDDIILNKSVATNKNFKYYYDHASK